MTKAEYEEYFREPGTFFNRHKRYLKTSLGRKGIFEKMEKLVSSDQFIGLKEANKSLDWSRTPTIAL